MSNVVQMFSGNNSRGAHEEYAQRADGVWFTRHYAWNGYGIGMTKWVRSPNQDLASLIDGDRMDYGFKPLWRCETGRCRLPRVAA